MQLVGLDGAQPEDLGVPVVGEEAEVAGAVVAEAGEELGGGEHEAGVEEPALNDWSQKYGGKWLYYMRQKRGCEEPGGSPLDLTATTAKP
ncbi:hypothetical protein V500_04955 [Pseudogymnoascus sp. VKM F-4518 (FW-2643)]|nr:hypothetical protein V500_04955 [Pseudogymnoascus sp. VKM F-4518 (FW-2643)]